MSSKCTRVRNLCRTQPVTVSVTSRTCIRKLIGSNLRRSLANQPDISCGVPQLLHANTGRPSWNRPRSPSPNPFENPVLVIFPTPWGLQSQPDARLRLAWWHSSDVAAFSGTDNPSPVAGLFFLNVSSLKWFQIIFTKSTSNLAKQLT
jgi:hypothetical protein